MKNNIAYLVYAQAAELFSVLRLWELESAPSERTALRDISVRRGLGPGRGRADWENAMGSKGPPSIVTEYGLKGDGKLRAVLAPLVDTY